MALERTGSPVAVSAVIGVLAAVLLAVAVLGISREITAQEADGNVETDPNADAPRSTGLPLPRFASLRANEVYMRSGPGTRYPIEWIYRRRGLPVQIIAEFDTWRKVRDWNGAVGWIHRAMLTGKRTAITTAADTTLLREPDPGAPVVARAESGVVAQLLSCRGPWCRIEARGLKGWVPRGALWGTLPGEKVD